MTPNLEEYGRRALWWPLLGIATPASQVLCSAQIAVPYETLKGHCRNWKLRKGIRHKWPWEHPTARDQGFLLCPFSSSSASWLVLQTLTPASLPTGVMLVGQGLVLESADALQITQMLPGSLMVLREISRNFKAKACKVGF